ncbi:MAG TPA: hydrogenase nickel incorporation protein HypB [Tepidisphaeraceae bacterium]|nr:hydrogenase nickel incorporation protein HypB [Tepidisphaeraceae bacterium]
MNISVVENVLKLNDEIAAQNRRQFDLAGLFVVDVMGAPGCGKTALIEKTIERLAPDIRVGVIVGDLATQRDAQRMARFTDQVVQVNTGKTCHLEANHIQRALENIDLPMLDILFIENVGNLICPVGFDLGQNVKVGVFCVTGGDDKAAKHPYIVYESDVLILNKIELQPILPFNLEIFRDDVKRLKPDSTLLELSSITGQGMDRWIEWLSQHVPAIRSAI